MKGKLGRILMCLGTVLLVMALSLFLYNKAQARQAQESTDLLLPQLLAEIREAETGKAWDDEVLIPGTPLEFVDPALLEMKEVEIVGNKYVGYVSIPDLYLELPVMSGWDYYKLKTAPCRYSGNLLTDDLVIMAHNFPHHFGRLEELTLGAMVSFTDAEGDVTRYEVVAIEVLAPTAVEDMTAGAFDLTLFTCTYGGRSRVTVRCDRLTAE